ncbi:MAG: nicotinate-nucleotide diphosphorylase (carboxylating) [Gammaproteobacteria bacterium]|jgi:nicotinate-nucleotide pyrophosphorylase (carboxylating)|nr:nicotinate-nucleotide diphosphorylase (carboxylating) [Gammaproteobacteria bacterium]|tara:strand:- start:3734 stop:4570 length:837 start_codon:yes stop_codon:yes gene_type:complete
MNIDYFTNLPGTVALAIDEDFKGRDLTAELIDSTKTSNAEIISRNPAVIAGRPWVDEVFRQIDKDVIIDWQVNDGDRVSAGALLFTLSGNARSLLTGERTALNFLQTLTGTATRTRHYVDLVKHTGVRLLDTRKTIPGLRLAQKYAVKTAGGHNHRIGLFDAFLIKENHIRAAGSIAQAVEDARKLSPAARVEVEVENLEEFRTAIAATPDWIMLDNFKYIDLVEAVATKTGGIKLEASGGIEQDSDLVRIAETGVDYISIGAMTKHCEAADLSMKFI